MEETKKTYLSPKELEHFKEKLLLLRRQLEVSAEGLHSGLEEHTQGDAADDDAEGVATAQGLLETDVQMLEAIELALERIEDNTYGICTASGEEIPKARLEALPYASMTVREQERLDLKNKQLARADYGDELEF